MNKNLVICPIGKESVHNVWCKKNKSFDIALIAYEDLKEKPSGNTYYRRKNGTKYPLIKWYLDKFLLKSKHKYDKYLLLDDDILIQTNDIETLFNKMDQYGCKIGSPAIQPINNPHKLMYPEPNVFYKINDWVEIAAICLTHETLLDIKDTFDTNVSGYGIQFIWNKEHKLNFGIFCDIPVIHSRPTASGSTTIYDTLEKGRESAYYECIEIADRLGIDPNNWETKVRYFTHPLSIVTLCTNEDAHYLPDYYESLPLDAEVCIVRTAEDEKATDWTIELRSEELEGRRKFALMNYPKGEWHYAKARNLAQTIATKPVIMALDPDERLMKHQHNYIKDMCLNLVNDPYVLGMYSRNVSVCENIEMEHEGKLIKSNSYVSQCRIYKNHPDIKWFGAVEESIDLAIESLGGKIKDSAILMHHVGYDQTPEQLYNKAKNKIEMILKHSEEFFSDGIESTNGAHWLNYIINHHSSYKHYKEIKDNK